METVFAQDIRVLIVEDEHIVSHHLKMTLLAFGYQVVACVSTAFEAIEAAKSSAPDIILMDVFLKGKMDGIEAANQIRQNKDIPIIFITASAHDEILERIRASRPYGYLSKPFEDRELKTNIDMAMFRWKLENEINKERSLAKHYLDMAAVIMLALDREGNITMINKLGAKLLGYHSKELIGKNWFKLYVPPSEYEFVYNNFKDVITSKRETSHHFENNIQTRFGVNRTISWNSTLLKDNDSRIIGILSAGEDITEKKIAQQKIIASEKNLLQAQKLAKIFTWEVDVLNRTLYPDISSQFIFSDDSANISSRDGISLDEFIALIHPDDQDSLEKLYINCVKTQKPYDTIYRLNTNDGTEKFIADHIYGVKVENGYTTRIQGLSQDITKRKKVEDALMQNDSSLLVINKLLSLTLSSEPPPQFIEKCLKIIVEEPLLKLKRHALPFLFEEKKSDALKLRGSYGDIRKLKGDIASIEAGNCVSKDSNLMNQIITKKSFKKSDVKSFQHCKEHLHLFLIKNNSVFGMIVVYPEIIPNDSTPRCAFFDSISNTVSNVIDNALIETVANRKLEELKQFQSLSIDREVKMRELKERITYLENQLKQKK
jgi:PAS domain S-box-containing protein